MKAIETRYKGYRFRSRLEARWAVFFDTASINWEYEFEGADLGGLGWYLPDFMMLHNLGRGPIVEIKPTAPTRGEIEKLSAVCALARDGAGAYGALIWGAPGKHNWIAFHKDNGARCGSEKITDLIDYLTAYERHGTPARWARSIKAARSARFDRVEAMA